MKVDKYNYWFRTILGLENIVLEELREKIDIKNYHIRQRSLFVEVAKPIKNENSLLKSIRTADDVYRFIGFYNKISKTKTSVDGFVEYFKNQILPSLEEYTSLRHFRITVSFVGRRNFSRFYIENKINELIKINTEFTVLSNENNDKKEENELRVRCHIEEEYAFVGIAVFDTPLHRREWRLSNYNGQLPPPIAAAMARFALSANTNEVIDPFCGSGTVLIESAIINHGINHTGYDINSDAIILAKERAELANVKINFNNADAFDTKIDYTDKIIISNPPWDNKHEINNIDVFVENLLNIILKSSRTILVISEDIEQLLIKKGLLFVELIKTRINGRSAIIGMYNKIK